MSLSLCLRDQFQLHLVAVQGAEIDHTRKESILGCPFQLQGRTGERPLALISKFLFSFITIVSNYKNEFGDGIKSTKAKQRIKKYKGFHPYSTQP